MSVGNELLLGNTINTNACWLATQVTSLGGSVTRITTVQDNLKEISTAVLESLGRRPDILITTGGIGPTFDDMTLMGVARALKMPVRVNPAAVQMIREHYARRFPGRKLILTKPRLKMAQLPIRGIPVRNPVGTAPAVSLISGETQIFCLPGVPKEAKAIFRESVSTAVRAISRGAVFAETWLSVHGVMESVLAPMIDRAMRRWPGVYIKSHPRGIEASGRPHIELHFSMSASEPNTAGRTLSGASHYLTNRLRRYGAKITSHT